VNPDPTRPDAPAEVVLACVDLDADVEFFRGLGFRVDLVFPADDPAIVGMSGHGLALRLVRGPGTAAANSRIPRPGPDAAAATLRIPHSGGARTLRAPNGTRIELVPPSAPLALPPLAPAFVLSRAGDGAVWHAGRAGMLYRDLVPDRQGGRFIASHIRIPDGGPVPDYVHFHRVAFQMIFCRRGWVRVVYEDQGEPFVMEAGDCVLQPPEIRHRVLESSPGLEVIEVSCPAEHETRVDHEMTLPTGRVDPGREFTGQRFVRHVARGAVWAEGEVRSRDTGIAEATGGAAAVRVLAPMGATLDRSHHGDFLFTYVLRGEARLRCGGMEETRLTEDDAFVVPPGPPHVLVAGSEDLEVLEVRLPAGPER